MASFSPQEGLDSIALITLTEATTYALAENVETFLSRDVLGRIADRGLLQTVGANYLGGGSPPVTFWGLAAHRFNQPEYLQPLHLSDPEMGQFRLPWRVSWELGRSFWDGRRPSGSEIPRGRRQWVRTMPLSGPYYEQASAYGPKNVDLEQAFDFVVFKPPARTAQIGRASCRERV